MGITYDFEGKVLKIKHAQTFANLRREAHVDSSLREDLTEVQASEAMLVLQRLREEKMKQSNVFQQSSASYSSS